MRAAVFGHNNAQKNDSTPKWAQFTLTGGLFNYSSGLFLRRVSPKKAQKQTEMQK